MRIGFTTASLAALAAPFLAISCGAAHKASVAGTDISESYNSASTTSLQQAGNDSLVFAKLDEYLNALDFLDVDSAQKEADFIICSVADSALRNRVGIKVYEHFLNSRYMGADNVAVHLFDRWFAPCTLVFNELDEFDAASFHALVNRRSLLGEKAVRLTMREIGGDIVTFPTEGRTSVIFFYSTRCSTCLLNSRELKSFLEKNDPDIDLYTVNTGSDEPEWQSYVQLNFKLDCSHTRVYNLSGDDADYILDYAVIKAPRLFLIEKHGIIAGRNLDTDALSRLLKVLCE